MMMIPLLLLLLMMMRMMMMIDDADPPLLTYLVSSHSCHSILRTSLAFVDARSTRCSVAPRAAIMRGVRGGRGRPRIGATNAVAEALANRNSWRKKTPSAAQSGTTARNALLTATCWMAMMMIDDLREFVLTPVILETRTRVG